MSAHYQRFDEDHWKHSGPHVWPKVTLYEVVDRYISRRPELGYLDARTKLLERYPEHPESLFMKISADARYGKRSRSAGSIKHQVIRQDKTEDVRAMLDALRKLLYRTFPQSPTPTLNCVLRFNVQDSDSQVIFTEKWI